MQLKCKLSTCDTTVLHTTDHRPHALRIVMQMRKKYIFIYYLNCAVVRSYGERTSRKWVIIHQTVTVSIENNHRRGTFILIKIRHDDKHPLSLLLTECVDSLNCKQCPCLCAADEIVIALEATTAMRRELRTDVLSSIAYLHTHEAKIMRNALNVCNVSIDHSISFLFSRSLLQSSF